MIRLAVAAVLVLVCCGGCQSIAGRAPIPGRAQIDRWCPHGGTRLDVVDSPFTLPVNAPGERWSLLVLATGGVDSTVPDPEVGTMYANGPSLDHVIICREAIPQEPARDR